MVKLASLEIPMVHLTTLLEAAPETGNPWEEKVKGSRRGCVQNSILAELSARTTSKYKSKHKAENPRLKNFTQQRVRIHNLRVASAGRPRSRFPNCSPLKLSDRIKSSLHRRTGGKWWTSLKRFVTIITLRSLRKCSILVLSFQKCHQMHLYSWCKQQMLRSFLRWFWEKRVNCSN